MHTDMASIENAGIKRQNVIKGGELNLQWSVTLKLSN